ncbi:MAG TPA: chemotaxis protein CheB [Fimbriimonas sp.]|nr:chemotaxis protein CheB [Fimbriimonas sp.]
MQTIDTIVIGSSAGGVSTLSALISKLPADLPAAIFVVMHFPEGATSVLPQILGRAGALKAKHATDGEEPNIGVVYVAPPGFHMILQKSAIRLAPGPKENAHRPSIDPLFRSAAHSRGRRVISVILSGLLDDGTLGSMAVRRLGGLTLAQEPSEASFADMPRNAIEAGGIQRVLSLDEIADTLTQLSGKAVDESSNSEPPDPVEMSLEELSGLESRGRPSAFVCPECQGTLFELDEEGVMHYRCRVGHSYLAESLSSSQENVMEAALWTAARAIEEHNDLLTGMLERAERHGFSKSAKAYRSKLNLGLDRLEILRRALQVTRNAKEPET